jgi:hypothetical protein
MSFWRIYKNRSGQQSTAVDEQNGAMRQYGYLPLNSGTR